MKKVIVTLFAGMLLAGGLWFGSVQEAKALCHMGSTASCIDHSCTGGMGGNRCDGDKGLQMQ